MPRKKRIWFKGAHYHIMGRGNQKRIIFQDDEDYQTFLRLLKISQRKTGFTLHACCLMTNHFHLELTAEIHPIWETMQPVMSHYAQIYNKKYNLVGHLFQSRYTSYLIQDERYFLEVSRYIHLNPVKANIVKDPLVYPYSSYRNYILNEKNPMSDLIKSDQILNPYFAGNRERYRKFVEDKISHEEHEQLIQKDINEDDVW